MTHDLVTLQREATVGMARDQMLVGAINSVLVCDDDGRAVGILTSHDLVDDWPADTPVVEVMTEPITSITTEASLIEAAEVMRSELIHHVVATEEGTAVGILSTFDLLDALITEK